MSSVATAWGDSGLEQRRSAEAAWCDLWRSPVVPVAVCATAGLAAARYLQVDPRLGWLLLVGGLALWPAWRHVRDRTAACLGLWLASAGAASVYHYQYREVYAADDISVFASETPQPRRIRGWVRQEPEQHHAVASPLMHLQPLPLTLFILEASAVETAAGWQSARGRLRVTIEGHLQGVHAGDTLEIFGQLARPPLPDNPGQADLRAQWRDERITAVLRVRHSPAAVVRWESGAWTSWQAVLARVRRWGETALRRHLPEQRAGLAAALLLGDTAALDSQQWDAYTRTGVVHVLAISGFHLTVLASFIWLTGRAAGLSARRLAPAIAVAVVCYTWLTGSRAPTVRAATMVCVASVAVALRRPFWSAHTFALAWLAVLILKPTDPFTIGCQLSFLSVFVLLWAGQRWWPAPMPSLAQRLRASVQSLPSRCGRWLWHELAAAYRLALLMFIALAPLLLYWKNILAPVSVVLGPPVTLTSSLALLGGFLTLALSPLADGIAAVPAALTDYALTATSWLVHQADAAAIGTAHAPAPPLLWVIGFYLLLAPAVLAPRHRLRCWLAALATWVLLGLALAWSPPRSDELRLAFLSVGHGSCVVLETPDGRTLLYDVGSMSGPRQTARIVAPYLWHRGIRQIDELFLSHADQDHFNGLPELLRLFPVGRISWTPSFAQRPVPSVQCVLEAVGRAGIPTRTLSSGDVIEAGSVRIQVLHPPRQGPEGTENTRSLVLAVHYAGQSMILTGDLEGIGQEMVARQPVAPAAVLMAPHHGGRTANAVRPASGNQGRSSSLLADWCRPRLVVSCQRSGPMAHLVAAYPGATIWDTASCGAVIVRVQPTGVTAEAFRSGQKLVVARAAVPPARPGQRPRQRRRTLHITRATCHPCRLG